MLSACAYPAAHLVDAVAAEKEYYAILVVTPGSKCLLRASLNSSASHLFQTPPPFSDWLYADRLHAIDW
ncbi:hypothetical protein T08_13861 [Trichinella sp. T8]|nr:hypothetical protein T08_13861 [Trichinella sp. T8]